MLYVLMAFSNCIVQYESLQDGEKNAIIVHWHQSNLLCFGLLHIPLLVTLGQAWRKGFIQKRAKWLFIAQALMSAPIVILNIDLVMWVLQNTDETLSLILLCFLLFGGFSLLLLPLVYYFEKSKRGWLRWIARILFLFHTFYVLSLTSVFEAIFAFVGYTGGS